MYKRQYVDLWNGNRFVKDLSLFPSPTRDMKGRRLKANTFDFPPFTYKTAEGYSGLEHKIISAIAENLHFKLDISPPPNGEQWGEFINGTYNGLVGQIYRGKSDIGWANFWVSHKFLRYIDFTSPFRNANICFMLKRPPPLPQWMAITKVGRGRRMVWIQN